jgi:hypothetical protein
VILPLAIPFRDKLQLFAAMRSARCMGIRGDGPALKDGRLKDGRGL